MQKFQVHYIKDGAKESEVIEADNKIKAMMYVKNDLGAKLIRVEEYHESFSFESLGDMSLFNTINMESYISLLREIQVMSDAGIALHISLEEIVPSIDDPYLKKIFDDILHEINSGKSLSHAFSKYKEKLGIISISLMRLSENTGNVSGSLDRLITILQDIEDNKKRFKKALFYPVTVISAIFIAFIILINFVIPKFKDVFDKLGADLPITTQILLGLDQYFSLYGIYIGAILLGGAVASWYLYHHNNSYRLWLDGFFLKIPIFGKQFSYSILGKFSMMMHELISVGISVTEAINIANETVDNRYVKEKLQTVENEIKKGIPLSNALKKSTLFEGKIIQIIRAGENSGKLDEMLGKVHLYYNNKFKDFVENISSYIEPILITFIGIMVLILALGIFMPMWNMANSVRMN
jgi:type II secretory pathway component PulF